MDFESGMMGFMLGQTLAGQPRKTGFSFVAIRFDPDFDFTPLLEQTTKGVLFEPTTKLELEFTNKFELKVFKKPKKWGEPPLLIHPMTFWWASNKDKFLCIALRNEIGSPMPANMSLFRNLLINLDTAKIKYELW